MDKQRVAEELVKVAKDLMAAPDPSRAFQAQKSKISKLEDAAEKLYQRAREIESSLGNLHGGMDDQRGKTGKDIDAARRLVDEAMGGLNRAVSALRKAGR